jgi:hypothetical protein
MWAAAWSGPRSGRAAAAAAAASPAGWGPEAATLAGGTSGSALCARARALPSHCCHLDGGRLGGTRGQCSPVSGTTHSPTAAQAKPFWARLGAEGSPAAAILRGCSAVAYSIRPTRASNLPLLPDLPRKALLPDTVRPDRAHPHVPRNHSGHEHVCNPRPLLRGITWNPRHGPLRTGIQGLAPSAPSMRRHRQSVKAPRHRHKMSARHARSMSVLQAGCRPSGFRSVPRSHNLQGVASPATPRPCVNRRHATHVDGKRIGGSGVPFAATRETP